MPGTPEIDERPKPLTALGFDFGVKHIGVAIGQTLTDSARALKIFRAHDGQPDWSELIAYVEQWRADILIVGLPLNMDGSESEFCRRARKFARRLRERSRTPVQMFDERLSTHAAKLETRAPDPTKSPGKSQSKAGVDALAARLILESWLAQPELAISPDP